MFKLNRDLIEKIKNAITPTQLAPAIGLHTMGCFGCSNECSGGCKGSCAGSCFRGCGMTCSGHTR